MKRIGKHFGFVPLADTCTAIYKVNGNLPDQLVGGRHTLERKGPWAFDEFPRTVAWSQQVRTNLVTMIIFNSAPTAGDGKLASTLKAGKQCIMTGYLAAQLNAMPVYE